MSIRETQRRIDQFADKEFGKGATFQEMANVEDALGVTLPQTYKDFLRRYGWARFSHHELYGVGLDVPKHLQLARNTLSERHEMGPPLPPSLIPVMNDGAGNHYCLETSQLVKGECPVVFWDHELGRDQEPVAVSSTFEDWLLNLLDRL
jgi:cell wall assembly regulator SMI1